MAEAKTMEDPAAGAPVMRTPDVYTYNGKQISEASVTSQGLACMQMTGGYVCKDSTSEFEGLEAKLGAASAGELEASAAASCGVVSLWLYRNKRYEGTALGLYNYYLWADIGANMNNATSSYRTGTASAHMSDFSGGGGYWFPGPTGYCNYKSNILQGYPEWNDRISSRYRY